MSDLTQIRLWDGVDHRIEDLSHSVPGVLEYARQHQVLREVLKPIRNATSNVVFLAALVSALILYNLQLFIGAWQDVLLIVITAFACLVVIALLNWSMERRHLPRTVSVDGGILVIKTPRATTETGLLDCLWFVGSPRNDPIAFGRGGAKCVVLCVPGRRNCVAVGITPELFDVWEGFLFVAGVPRGRVRTFRGVIVIIVAGLRGLLASVLIANLPLGRFAGNSYVEFMRAFGVCVLPLISICYGTVRAGTSWWYFREWEAYLYSMTWFAVPTIIAVAWASADWYVDIAFGAFGLVLHLGVFMDLRRRARENDGNQ